MRPGETRCGATRTQGRAPHHAFPLDHLPRPSATLQTDRAAAHAAAAARAELTHALEDAHLARRVNDAVAAHCGGLAADLAGWRDLGASVSAKEAALAERAAAAVSALTARVDALEAGVAALDERSRRLAAAAGVEEEADGGAGSGGGGGDKRAGLGGMPAALGRAARRAMLGWPAGGGGGAGERQGGA